jgi:hypothetical protein
MIIKRLHNGGAPPPIHKKAELASFITILLFFSWSHKAVSLPEDYATELGAHL